MAIVVIVDDSEEELQHSLSVLKSMGQFEEIYGFSCPVQTYRFIEERGCDLMFVEAEIKGMNCFAFIDSMRQIRQDIQYVIITLNEDCAYEAFQKEIADYILKPMSSVAVTKTIEKLKRHHCKA